MSIATHLRHSSSRIRPGRQWRPADARAYFASDRTRTIQTILGLIWLLDGALQLQPFMYSDGFVRMLAAGAAGQPAWLAGVITFGVHLMRGDVAVFNTVFALTQVGIGLGLLCRATVKPALAVSLAWAAIVWSVGEGFGMLLAGSADPVTGAPGAVGLYVLVGLLVWPGARRGGLVGARGARIMWAALWLAMAWLWLLASNDSAQATRDAILNAAPGAGALGAVARSAAGAAAGHGTEIAVALAVVSAAIGLGVALDRRPRAWLAVAVVLNVSYWLLGQAAGGLFTGSATDPNAGPLFVLLAATLWDVVGPARSRPAGALRPRSRLRPGGSRRAAIAAMSFLCVAGAVAGCGGRSQTTNGIAAKSPGAIVSAAARAMDSLRSVHVSGSQVQDGVPVSIDMDLVSGSGARGQMSVAGRAFRFVAVSQTLYINAGPAFWTHATGSSAAAQRLQGKWLKTSLGSAQFTAVASLINLQDIVQSVVDGHGILAPGSRATINGHNAVTVHDTTRGGTMYIATVGRPYMLELSNPHTGLGHVMFDHFNAPVSLTPPANPIDAAQ